MVAVLDGLPGALLPADVLDDVVDALDSSEHRDALIARALGSLRSSLHELGHQLATGDVELDLIRVLVAVSGQDRAEVVAGRRTSSRSWPGCRRGRGTFGLALFLVGGAGLCRRRPRRASASRQPRVRGSLAAGGAVGASWLVLSRLIGSPLGDDRPFGEPPGGPRWCSTAPRRSRRRAAARAVAARGCSPATVLIICGAGCVLGGLAVQLWTSAWRFLAAGGSPVRWPSIATSGVLAVPAPRGVVEARRRCNGHAELCDRRYDEIVQAATHNSMSSPDVVRVWPEHDGNILQQLEFGVRTLMIDASYWPGVGDSQLEDLRDLLGAGDTGTLIDAIEARLAPRPASSSATTCARSARCR